MSASQLWDQITAMFPGLPDSVREFTLTMRVGEVPTITVEFYVLDAVPDSGEGPSVTRSFRIVDAGGIDTTTFGDASYVCAALDPETGNACWEVVNHWGSHMDARGHPWAK